MSNEKKSVVERLAAADPALTVTQEDLARSRRKSLAVMQTDAVQLAVGGSVEQFHRQPPVRRFRVIGGVGLVAAAAAVVVGVFASSLNPQQLQQPVPGATQSAVVPESDSSGPSQPPEIVGAKAATGAAEIVVGGNGNKAAVSTDEGVNVIMDALFTGTLGLNSGGCFAGIHPDGTSGGLVFPFGTQVTATGVILPDGTPVNLGDSYAFGGGGSPGHVDLGECSPAGTPFLVQSWDGLASK